MVIEKVHGLQATTISLNDRFTILASAANVARVMKPRRSFSGLFPLNNNLSNRVFMDKIAHRLGQQTRKHAVKQRLGMPGLRRFGSESSILGIQRSNSAHNLNPNSIRNRVSWRQSNNNLNRSASFSNLPQGVWRGRGFRRRGGRMGVMRGRMRGRGGRGRPGQGQAGPGRAGPGRAGPGRAGQGRVGQGRAGRPRPPMTPNRGRGRGGVTRQQVKALPTKEELDLQLDQYMASTKSALDKQLDQYMKNAMDLE